MKILKAKNKIEGCETLVADLEKLDFGHCAIDGPGFIKLYNSITETMNWPLILFNGKLKYGNKYLLPLKPDQNQFLYSILNKNLGKKIYKNQYLFLLLEGLLNKF